MSDKIQIRFDGPPGHESGRFVEVEDSRGKSFSLGEWVQDSGHWLLVFDDPRRIAELQAENEQLTAQVLRLTREHGALVRQHLAAHVRQHLAAHVRQHLAAHLKEQSK